MLLPDQTYEQCQEILAPLKAIRKILEDSNVEPKLFLEKANGKCANNSIVIEKKKKKLDKIHKFVGATDKPHQNESALRVDTPENFGKTSDFFNNIPDYTGDPLGPFTLPDNDEHNDENGADGCDGIKTSKTSADVLKECELFLHKHRIRPDFFCRYRKAIE